MARNPKWNKKWKFVSLGECLFPCAILHPASSQIQPRGRIGELAFWSEGFVRSQILPSFIKKHSSCCGVDEYLEKEIGQFSSPIKYTHNFKSSIDRKTEYRWRVDKKLFDFDNPQNHLLHACLCGDIEMVRFLIDYKDAFGVFVTPNAPGYSG